MIITQITFITVLGTDIRQNFYKSFAFSILLAYTYICYILRKDFVITMSDFSQRLEKEIQNTGKTLCYLAEASGLQLDYISKMNKGKRIPKEEDRLVRLLTQWNVPPAQNLIFCFSTDRKKWEKASGNVWKNLSISSSRM